MIPSLTLPRRILAATVLALALAAFAFAQAAPAMAAPKVRTSLGVSCSSKNGVQTVKLTVKASGSGGATIDRLIIDIDPNPGDDPAEFDSTTDFEETVILNPAAGSYTIKVTVEATGASDVVKNGTATIAPGKCSVKIG